VLDRSRGSVTVNRNGLWKGSKDRTVAGLKAHDNVPRISNNDHNDDDDRRETLASDGKKIETSKKHNLGNIKVDPAFVVLKPTAQEFLQAQGITSALTFMAINANDLAPAWVEWNEGAFKTNEATMDLRCWKRKVRHQWSSSSKKGGDSSIQESCHRGCVETEFCCRGNSAYCLRSSSHTTRLGIGSKRIFDSARYCNRRRFSVN
jgi:hypothetical protein